MIVGQPFIDDEKRSLLAGFVRRRHRTMEQFARDELVITTGPYPGRFQPERQPHMLWWYRLIDSGQFSELLATGPSQSGKTLNCFVVPLLYHLFELQETVIAAVPDGDMIGDKWSTDILPVIEASRYRDLLPIHGSGSKGGLGIKMQFRHGPILRWMTAGGDDKRRAHFTSRVICFTETDGFDSSTETSSEGTKLDQIEARARSFPEVRRRIYKECTVSLKERHTWHTYEQRSTHTRLLMPCQHCGSYVLPEREHLIGWRGADSVEVARTEGQFACPACGEGWSEHDRKRSVKSCVAVHAGQSVQDDGTIVGQLPDTRTLGFRWSACHNLLLPAGDIAADEYRAERASDEDAKQRAMCQFVWATPYVPLDVEQVELTPEQVERRASGWGRGVRPSDTSWVGIGIDVNQSVLHWAAIAFRSSGSAHVMDYGTTGVKHRDAGFSRAIAAAIQHLSVKIVAGWSDPRYDRVHVDCRWKTADVIASIKALKDKRWRAHLGLGKGQFLSERYTEPVNTDKNKQLVWLGTRCYEQAAVRHQAILMYADANFWKGYLQERLSMDLPPGGEVPAGAITIFEAAEGTHSQYARHLTAEREDVEFDPKRGPVKVFKAIRSANHWFDATYLALTAGHRCGYEGKIKKVSGSVTQPAPTIRVTEQEEQREFHAPHFIYPGGEYD